MAVGDLVRAASVGNDAAFTELYVRFAPVVHGVLLSHADPDDVDDLVQEVFLLALRHMKHIRNPDAFPGWVVSAARNAARMRSRSDRIRRNRTISLTTDVASVPAASEEEVDAKIALAAIQELPRAYRETLVLRLVEGLSGSEIASRTGLSEGSVRVNLHRGFRMLRDKLGGDR